MTAILKPSRQELMRSRNPNPIASLPNTNRSRYQKQHQSQSLTSSPRNRSQAVSVLPNLQTTPAWVKALVLAQRGSTIATFCLVSGALAVYSWTVYSQTFWGKEYSHLEQLQKNQRQLTEANEALKNQIAQQAETPEAGLVLPDANNTIFLQAAPDRPLRPDPITSVIAPTPLTMPMGY